MAGRAFLWGKVERFFIQGRRCNYRYKSTIGVGGLIFLERENERTGRGFNSVFKVKSTFMSTLAKISGGDL